MSSGRDLEDYEYRYYREMKDGILKVRFSASLYRCPFCFRERKRDYRFKYLLWHASAIGRSSRTRDVKEKAKHLALERYMKRHLGSLEESKSKIDYCDKGDSKPELTNAEKIDILNGGKEETKPGQRNSPHRGDEEEATSSHKTKPPHSIGEKPLLVPSKEAKSKVAREDSKAETGNTQKTACLNSGKEETEPGHRIDPCLGDGEAARSSHKTKPPHSTGGKTKLAPKPHFTYGAKEEARSFAKVAPKPAQRRDTVHAADPDQKFVFPWVGILANIQTVVKDGQHVGESGTKLRMELASKGFNPQRLQPLWSPQGHSGFAVVVFEKTWEGLRNAIMFEKSFEVDHRGKRDFYVARDRGDKLYGWVARDDDFYSVGIVGNYLRKNGDLKTISGKEAEEQNKESRLVQDLTNTLESKRTCVKEMKGKISETNRWMNRVMAQKDEMLNKHNREMKMIRKNARDSLEEIHLEHEKAAQGLEAQKKELAKREKQLSKLKTENETERKKLEREKQKNERATREQKKADEEVMRLAAQQQREKEELHRKILELEQNVDAEQALELEMERMKGELQVLQHMGEAEDAEIKKKMEAIREELKDKEEEWEHQESINQALIVRQRNSNDELQDARKALIKISTRIYALGIRELPVCASVGVKRMGALDTKPFLEAAKLKHKKKADEKAVELCSLWEDYLRDPSWHPFKMIEKDGGHEEVLNEEDEKLKGLRIEYGEEAFNAVAGALKDLNEYNPSGRYPVPELWNFKEDKKASLKEGVSDLLKIWKLKKPKPPKPKRQ